jgi:hypothetical protein
MPRTHPSCQQCGQPGEVDASGMCDACIDEWTTRSCEAQGVPRHLTGAALDPLVTLIAAARREDVLARRAS